MKKTHVFTLAYSLLSATMISAYVFGWFLEPATRLTRVPDTLYCLSWIFITLKSLRDRRSGYPPLLIPYPLIWELLAIYYINVTGMLPFMQFNYVVWLLCSFVCFGVIAKFEREEFTFGHPKFFFPKFLLESSLIAGLCILYASMPGGLEGFFIDIGCFLATLISIMFFALLVKRPTLDGQSFVGNVLRIFAELGSLSYTLSLHTDSLFLKILFVFTLLLDLTYIVIFIRRRRSAEPEPTTKFVVASFLAVCFVATSFGCSHSPTNSEGTRKRLGIFELDYFQYRDSVPGRWLVTANIGPEYSKDATSVSTIFALDTEGRTFPLKTLRGKNHHRIVMDARRVLPNLYAYVVCEKAKDKCSETEVRFLDSEGADVIWIPTPGADVDLNFHDFHVLPTGNVLYLFSSLDFGARSIENRIQEWNRQGRAVFSWKLDDHLNDLGSLDRTAHINSIDSDDNGHIIVGIPRSNAILKIDKRSGKVRANISKPEWKFIDDPYGGFVFQHSVRWLPNGNLLMFDNGDGVNGRATRAVEYKIDDVAKTATLVWEYRIPDDDVKFRNIGGSVQRLSNGNTLISWGVSENLKVPSSTRLVSEVDRERRLVREIRSNILAYRVWFDEVTP